MCKKIGEIIDKDNSLKSYNKISAKSFHEKSKKKHFFAIFAFKPN